MEWLLWLDLETSGLDSDTSDILQVAFALTNFDLSITHGFHEYTIYQDKSIIDNMDPWCRDQHMKSGLLDHVFKSEHSIIDAENAILRLLNSEKAVKDTVYIAGNSVHFDKKFVDRYMKRLSKMLSYRIVDVSTLSIIFKNTQSDIYLNKPHKRFLHTALSDIEESVNEYSYYLTQLDNTLGTKN